MRFARSIAAALLTVSALASFSALADDEESRGCSTAAFVGRYSYNGEGSAQGIGPMALTGTFTVDGAGRISGQELVSLNGTIVPATYTGTYTVGSNCMGTAQYQMQVGASTLHRQVALALANGMRDVFYMSAVPGSTVTGMGKKQ